MHCRGMEKEIAEKTEKLTELEGQLDVAIGKLQKVRSEKSSYTEPHQTHIVLSSSRTKKLWMSSIVSSIIEIRG